MVDTLIIKELTFSAAHYLPEHPKCGCIHGHTYFVRNLRITTTGFVDFGDVIKAVMSFDHTFIIPKGHWEDWLKLQSDFDRFGIFANFEMTDGPPTVENISKELRKRIVHISNAVLTSRFDLFEGPNQGVKSG